MNSPSVGVDRDKILTAGLVRPCLVPLQHVHMELADLESLRQGGTGDMSCSMESLVYFRHVM